MLLPARWQRREGKHAVVDFQHLAGRHDIDGVRLHGHRTGHLLHAQRRRTLEQLGQHAFMLRGQVQHDHERHAGGSRHGREEVAQCLDGASRSTQSDHRQCGVAGFGGAAVCRTGLGLLGGVRGDLVHLLSL